MNPTVNNILPPINVFGFIISYAAIRNHSAPIIHNDNDIKSSMNLLMIFIFHIN